MPVFIPKHRKLTKYVEGTPIFQKTIGAISASSSTIFDIAEAQSTWRKWLPFNSVSIINNGGTDITIYINQESGKAVYLPSGSIRTVTDQAIWSIKITNNSSTTATTADKITMDFEGLGADSDTVAKRFAKSPLGFLIGLGGG